MKVLRANRMDRCIGCHSCSLACARQVHKQLSWNTSGIRIRSSGGVTTGFEALLCLACDPAACVAACPTGAFSQRKGGGVIVKRPLCIHCGRCAQACPVEAIYLDHDQTPYVCIHCGRCVPYCPHDCIGLVSSGEAEGEQPPSSNLSGATPEPGPTESVSSGPSPTTQEAKDLGSSAPEANHG